MTGWLVETLVWTALLIAFVLIVRRPVARHFGPQVAYALWALPALRLIMPPIELPAWMAPEKVIDPQAHAAALADAALAAAIAKEPLSSEAAAPVGPAPQTLAPTFDVATLIEVGMGVWLIGAAIFLFLRFSAYFRLRDELLEGSADVGRDGKVRLVETDGTKAPLAFGVIDKVIALPRGFLAQPDQQARDLALAHEMAHHKGQDLLINVLVQPLFALHWFNPLGRYGWLALRRDQEAACDARVVAAKPAEEREAYANLIVTTAAGPNVALAAPMACPVLGEKSIIHRLRSLKMSDTTNSRRLSGRLMLGAAVIALPLTATVSYAAADAPLPPAPPAPPAPVVSVAPPAPPAPPLPPVALQSTTTIVEIDPDAEITIDGEEVEVEEDGRVIVKRGENVFVVRSEFDEDKEGSEERAERIVRRLELRNARRLEEGEMEKMMIELREAQKLDEGEMQKIIIEMRKELDEAHRVVGEVPTMIAKMMEDGEWNTEGRFAFKMECDENSSDVASTFTSDDGTQTVLFCQKRVMNEAIKGLREAREGIAADTEMSAETRARILEELDRQIEKWSNDNG